MKPILFNTPMAQALLNTKPDVWPAEPIDASKPFKWQTRRVIKPQPTKFAKSHGVDVIIDDGINAGKRPYFVGDILYVRETWQSLHNMIEEGAVSVLDDRYFYRANDSFAFDDNEMSLITSFHWKPSIFMPREAARLFLEVKNIRTEQVGDVREADAKAEGASKLPICTALYKLNPPPTGCYGKKCVDCELAKPLYLSGFAFIWDRTCSEKSYKYIENPYVFVYEIMRRSADGL
jgi:hypothetical protein